MGAFAGDKRSCEEIDRGQEKFREAWNDVAQIAADLPQFQESTMNMTVSLAPLVSLLAGILILVVPRLLNYIVAIYLIVIGLLGLFGAGNFHLK